MGIGGKEYFLVLSTPFHDRRNQTNETSRTKPIKYVCKISNAMFFWLYPGKYLYIVHIITTESESQVKMCEFYNLIMIDF